MHKHKQNKGDYFCACWFGLGNKGHNSASVSFYSVYELFNIWWCKNDSSVSWFQSEIPVCPVSNFCFLSHFLFDILFYKLRESDFKKLTDSKRNMLSCSFYTSYLPAFPQRNTCMIFAPCPSARSIKLKLAFNYIGLRRAVLLVLRQWKLSIVDHTSHNSSHWIHCGERRPRPARPPLC